MMKAMHVIEHRLVDRRKEICIDVEKFAGVASKVGVT